METSSKKKIMWKTLTLWLQGEYSPRYITGAATIVYRKAVKYLRRGEKIASISSEFHEDMFATRIK